MRIERALSNRDHSFRCVVTGHPEGWEVRRERDSVVVRDEVRRHWQRVERDLLVFDLDAMELREQGWVDLSPPADALAAA